MLYENFHLRVTGRVQDQLNAMWWEVLKHSVYILDLLSCSFASYA